MGIEGGNRRKAVTSTVEGGGIVKEKSRSDYQGTLKG